VLRQWRERPLTDLLAEHDLVGRPEVPFPNDGWSGATLTTFDAPGGGERRVLKRTSWQQDWIARATRDHALREGFVATGQLPLPKGVVAPYLGAGADGTAVAMLMPDLSGTLIPWDRPDGTATLDTALLDRVLVAAARLHETPLETLDDEWPWCPLGERLLLLSPTSAGRFVESGVKAGSRFLEGWAAYADVAPASARDLVESLDADPGPLLDALELAPPALLHGDLKLANVAPQPDGRVALIDWQMVMVAPVAVDLGWFLVGNSGALPTTPHETLERYRAVAASDGPSSEWARTVDLAVIVGLLLRGWRKGTDARAGAALPSGTAAVDDLEWWCSAAVDAASRRL
jgi:hypothetical protein